jgi:hypothetical protein
VGRKKEEEEGVPGLKKGKVSAESLPVVRERKNLRVEW